MIKKIKYKNIDKIKIVLGNLDNLFLISCKSNM